MTTETYYMIQMSEEFSGIFGDMPGMPNGGRGFDSLDEAAEVLEAKYKPLERNICEGRFRVVRRVVTDTPIQL